MIDLDGYQQAAARTLNLDLPHREQLSLGALGLAGEGGEVVELIKKALFHGTELPREQLKKELGDVLWYLAAIATTNGLSLSEVAAANIKKLQVRYPGGFSEAASLARVDVGEG